MNLVDKRKLLHIGTFERPVGLKGDIKVATYTSNLKFYLRYGSLMSEDSLTSWDLKLVRESNGKVIVKVKNLETFERAESLKGKKIFVERRNLPKIKKNEFYVVDLIDCKVVSIDNKLFGLAQSIENFGAGDLINVESKSSNNFYIPMNEDNIVSVDLQKKIIIISPMKGIID